MGRRSKRTHDRAPVAPPPPPPRAPPPYTPPEWPDALDARLVQTRARLLFLHPFIGYLVTHLRDELGARDVLTSRTDGDTLFWSDAYLRSLSCADLMFALAHHALHCALGHPWPGAAREAWRWDLACDLLVDALLSHAGLTTALSPGVGPALERRATQPRRCEEIYADIARDPRAYPLARASVDVHDDWSRRATLEPRERMRRDRWRHALVDAARFGKLPAGLEHLARDAVSPRRHWRELLHEGLFWQADYTMSPTDRRFADVLVPTLHGEVHRVVIAIDLEHRWRSDLLRSFWAEALTILRNNRCEAWVAVFDRGGVRAAWDGWEFDDAVVTDSLRHAAPVCGSLAEFVEGRADAGWQAEALVCLTPRYTVTREVPPLARVFYLVPPDCNLAQVTPAAPRHGEFIVFDAAP